MHTYNLFYYLEMHFDSFLLFHIFIYGCAENTILRFAYVYIMSCLAAHPYMDSFS